MSKNVICTQRLALTADRSALVLDTDPRAATLYAVPGDEIPASAAEKFGLVDGALPGSEQVPLVVQLSAEELERIQAEATAAAEKEAAEKEAAEKEAAEKEAAEKEAAAKSAAAPANKVKKTPATKPKRAPENKDA